MYIYACVYAFVHLCVYTRVYVYVYAYLRIDCGSWYQCFSVWTESCMHMCFRVHMYAYTYVCRYIYMYIFFCIECYMHFTGVVGTSAWAGVYVTQVCFYTNVHDLTGGSPSTSVTVETKHVHVMFNQQTVSSLQTLGT